jgi:hypothetical protein
MRKRLAICAALLAAGCALDSDGMLAASGYSIALAPYAEEFALRVHANQLRQLGGDTKSARFHLYVSERLRIHGLCPGGWEELFCGQEWCVERTDSSVTVRGRCVPTSPAPQGA